MNEKHMGEIERQLLQISRSRKRLREAARELAADNAEIHLVEALQVADRDIEKAYKALFQSTYFHIPEDEPTVTKSREGTSQQSLSEPPESSAPVPEHTQETLLP